MKCHWHPDREASGYCSVCASGVCPECRHEVAGTIRCPQHATQLSPVPAAVAPAAREKSPFLSVIFSFLPGLGHIYLGAYQRGIIIGLIFAFLCAVTSHGGDGLEPLFGIAIAFVWFFAIFDAYRICRAINTGGVMFPAVPGPGGGFMAPAIPKPSQRTGTLTWGIILVGFGILIVLDRYADLDTLFDWLGNNIGFVFIVLGIILLATYIRHRMKEKEKELAASATDGPAAGPGNSLLK